MHKLIRFHRHPNKSIDKMRSMICFVFSPLLLHVSLAQNQNIDSNYRPAFLNQELNYSKLFIIQKKIFFSYEIV